MTHNLHQQAAFILLDAAVAYESGTPSGRDSAMNVAVRRLGDVPGIVSVTESGGTTNVDVSPLVNGGIVSIYVLSFWLAQERGVDIEAVFAELRDAIEDMGDR